MDSLTHTFIGAALCSRTGLAGGLRGAVRRDGSSRLLDWTFWAALFFGAFPDAFSLGIYLIPRVFMSGHAMWHGIPPYIFTLYRLTHSLVIVLGVILLVGWLCRPLAVTMLAWPIHILTDVFTHGAGIFQTPLFYPVSSFRISGVNWWEHPVITWTGWLLTAALWIGILCFRYLQLSGILRRNTAPGRSA